MLGIIYKITSPNNKIYIGQTINLDRRLKEYSRCKFQKQTKLWNNCSIHQWNPNDKDENGIYKFIEIVESCNISILDIREIYWIDQYKSFDTNHGLNLTIGGKGNSIVSEEVKKKISETNKGRKFSEELKKIIKEKKSGKPGNRFGSKHTQESLQKMSNSLKGKPSYWKGKPFSEETKKKISESKKGKISPRKGVILSKEIKQKISKSKKEKNVESHNAIKIYQYNCDKKLIKIWKNISSIRKEFKISYKRLIKNINTNEELFGFYWYNFLLT